MRTVLCGLLLLSVCAYGEMRIWSDKQGNEIEAEYVQRIGAKVVLKTADGRKVKVPMSGLSADDMAYMAALIPPKIVIDVDPDLDRDTVESYSSAYGTYGRDTKSEIVKCRVELKKTNQEPTSRRFVAHLYIIGRNLAGDTRKLFSYTKYEFDFKNGDSAQFSSDPVRSQYTKSNYSSNYGFRYEGYLVYVEDTAGELLKLESSSSKYEKYLHKLKEAKPEMELDSDFDLIQPRNRRS